MADEREITWDDKLACNQQIAEIIKMAAHIDMDVVRAILRDAGEFDTLGPILNPTHWRAVGEETRAGYSVVRGMADFLSVLDKASPVDWRALHREE